MPSELSRLKGLLERVMRGPLQDPELMQITLEVVLKRAIEDLERERRRAHRRLKELQDLDEDDLRELEGDL